MRPMPGGKAAIMAALLSRAQPSVGAPPGAPAPLGPPAPMGMPSAPMNQPGPHPTMPSPGQNAPGAPGPQLPPALAKQQAMAAAMRRR